jgi:hypothetical protein
VRKLISGDSFPSDEPTIRVELTSSQSFKTGVLNLSYTPAKN